MSDNPLANLQPDNGGGDAPTPPAPDPAPAPPAPDPTPPADNQPTEAEKADQAEWDRATEDLFPALKKEDKNDEQPKPPENPKAPEAPSDPQKGDEPPKPGNEEKPKDGESEESEDEPVAPADAIARRTARQEQAALDSVKSDIREKMFKDAPTELRAGDGELLDTVDKVMQYTNPATGEPFTREEATLWLSQSERALEKQTAEMNATVERIADVQLDLKDQADVVNYEYGELLVAMPDLQKKLWGEYEKTLTKDPKSGIITNAPVSLQEFYAAALEPYAQLGRQLEQQESDKTVADQQASEAAKQQAEQAKQQRRQDRSDIYGSGKTDTQTEDEKEWAAAAEAVFGPLK